MSHPQTERRENPFRRLPQELFDAITNETPPNVTKQIANASSKHERADNILWRTIFASDEWINLAEKLLKESPYVKAPGPILIGKDLSSIGNPSHNKQKHHHILLAPNDWTGDLRYHQENFFNSLRTDYRYLQKEQKVIFPKTTLKTSPGGECLSVPGITLYIESLDSAEMIELPRKELKRLFDKKLIRTQYSTSSLKKVQTINISDVCGLLGKRLSTPGDLSPICGLTFKTSIGSWQLIFITPEADKYKLKAIGPNEGSVPAVTGWEGVRKNARRWWL
ncbi:hypothetical protein CBS147333_10230 [Penicillium roqueforti]|nr:hypothetical protein CBS147333_10230 [Penicillium roqueforti]KAI3187434.1 hypothetical protein CBS147311_10205 [Penicillium roqueforti]KAI3260757.1 hypothetical protein CBS147308_10219 [Penicillium roqueforti]KAI3276048.1 hypothetical protein DTO003C3_10227 [Penicillium roqueforti]